MARAGVATIFTWRLVAKEVCHAVLPPTFRFFSSYLLPRRHYLVATECQFCFTHWGNNQVDDG